MGILNVFTPGKMNQCYANREKCMNCGDIVDGSMVAFSVRQHAFAIKSDRPQQYHQ